MTGFSAGQQCSDEENARREESVPLTGAAPDERMADSTYRVRCMVCGKSVSSPLVEPVTVRAWVICPECIERHGVDGGRARI